MIPNPGSDEALDLGCLCPVLDNEHGNADKVGYYQGIPMFWITVDCPIHVTDIVRVQEVP